MLRFLIILIILFFKTNIFAQEDYFLTLRYDEVNLRQGPSKEYPIKIFYKKNFYLFWFKNNLIILEKLKIMKIILVGYIYLNFQKKKQL